MAEPQSPVAGNSSGTLYRRSARVLLGWYLLALLGLAMWWLALPAGSDTCEGWGPCVPHTRGTLSDELTIVVVLLGLHCLFALLALRLLVWLRVRPPVLTGTLAMLAGVGLAYLLVL
ncbi:hypothetical protein [Rugosimonospora africana]|uniref:hypothetical protein n=1 Tax=Rugosimonospora africana TaxID=556532 RepID=UPI00194053C4|nr:hypothetical protein [Rugosimonospora africana]